MNYQDFSSLPPEQERQFVAFERRTVESGKKAWTIGFVSAGAFAVVLLIIVFSYPAPKAKHTDALECDLPAEPARPKRAAPAPDPEPAAAPAEAAPAEAAPAEAAPAEAPAEGKTP
jgi:hypothetical protein